MSNINRLINENVVISLVNNLSHPQYYAEKINNDKMTWKDVLLIYFGLLTISTFLINSIFEFHRNGETLNNLKLNLFQVIYVFIFSFAMRCVIRLFKGTIKFEKILKLSFIYGGVISIANNFLMMFSINLEHGGNRFIVLLVSCLVAFWIIRSYLAILNISQVNGKVKKSMAILTLIFTSLFITNITSVIAPYLIILNR